MKHRTSWKTLQAMDSLLAAADDFSREWAKINRKKNPRRRGAGHAKLIISYLRPACRGCGTLVLVVFILIAVGKVAGFFMRKSQGKHLFSLYLGKSCSFKEDCGLSLLVCDKVHLQERGTCEFSPRKAKENLKVQDQKLCECALELAIRNILHDRDNKYTKQRASMIPSGWILNGRDRTCQCADDSNEYIGQAELNSLVKQYLSYYQGRKVIPCFSSAKQMKREYEKHGPFLHHFKVHSEMFTYPNVMNGLQIMRDDFGSSHVGFSTFEIVGFGTETIGRKDSKVGQRIPYVMLKTPWGSNFGKNSHYAGYLRVSEDVLDAITPVCKGSAYRFKSGMVPRLVYHTPSRIRQQGYFKIQSLIEQRNRGRETFRTDTDKLHAYDQRCGATDFLRYVCVCYQDSIGLLQNVEGPAKLIYADITIVQGLRIYVIISKGEHFYRDSIWVPVNPDDQSGTAYPDLVFKVKRLQESPELLL